MKLGKRFAKLILIVFIAYFLGCILLDFYLLFPRTNTVNTLISLATQNAMAENQSEFFGQYGIEQAKAIGMDSSKWAIVSNNTKAIQKKAIEQYTADLCTAAKATYGDSADLRKSILFGDGTALNSLTATQYSLDEPQSSNIQDSILYMLNHGVKLTGSSTPKTVMPLEFNLTFLARENDSEDPANNNSTFIHDMVIDNLGKMFEANFGGVHQDVTLDGLDNVIAMGSGISKYEEDPDASVIVHISNPVFIPVTNTASGNTSADTKLVYDKIFGHANSDYLKVNFADPMYQYVLDYQVTVTVKWTYHMHTPLFHLNSGFLHFSSSNVDSQGYILWPQTATTTYDYTLTN